jgi:hypothetical protein
MLSTNHKLGSCRAVLRSYVVTSAVAFPSEFLMVVPPQIDSGLRSTQSTSLSKTPTSGQTIDFDEGAQHVYCDHLIYPIVYLYEILSPSTHSTDQIASG